MTDPFINALKTSHQITVRGELLYGGTPVKAIPIVGGSVTADRAGSVRRTAQITLDPSVRKDADIAPRLNPYGSIVKLWRGVRYPSSYVDEQLVFYGRIDTVDTSYDGVTLRCSDMAANVMDARFTKTTTPATYATTTFITTIKALITEALPGVSYNTHGIPDKALIGSVSQWGQERGDALDMLCTQLPQTATVGGPVGCEWYVDMAGVAHVAPLPAVVPSGVTPVWTIDTGNVGVLVDRVAKMDRQGVYNGVIVDGEPVGGVTPAHGEWYLGTGDMAWGGAFGKVVGYYSGQQLNPNNTASANALAQQLGLNSIASVKAVSVTCVPNPKLKEGEVVYVFTGNADLDGLFFVQSLTLPLEPETPMTLTLYQSMLSG